MAWTLSFTAPAKGSREQARYSKKWAQQEEGQMSIFFAITLLILITCMAFIINVGMFVKAKINLQNAVDASAYAGAAVQARQLSNISYLNWEMRNVYKEWMFKYYVLGQLGNPKTNPADSRGRYAASGGRMDFRIARFDASDIAGDFFNVPSNCIHHAGGVVNICEIYSLPGLPRFSPLGLVGIDETHNEFMNAIVAEKANDCAKRANLNYGVTVHWIYGTTTTQSLETPQIASQRIGAWPKAFELAVRVRNLEKMVNDPPSTTPMCLEGMGCTNVGTFDQRLGELPLHERKVKAFWSGYRNLENNDGADNLKRTFRLTELAPTVKTVAANSVNGLLIPDGTQKYYVDLRLILLNFVNFYTLFTPFTGDLGSSTTVQKEAACDSVKTGLPVPGYPLGFDKNPEFLTYYAVKGEAEYTGLFNPFQSATKMVAYAAAKPFGGRTGPMLFMLNKNFSQEVRARTGSKRSYSYISGIVTNGQTANFVRGYPMPIAPTFWTNASAAGSTTLGGHPSLEPRYGIPNMIYDVVGSLADQGGGDKPIHEIIKTDDRAQAQPVEDAGLYQKNQFSLLKNNLQNLGGGAISNNLIYDGITRTLAPTLYEGMNYLIPTQDVQRPGVAVASAPSIIPYDDMSNSGALGNPYTLLAPLWGPGTFFEERANILTVFEEFLRLNRVSIERYLRALHDIAKEIVSQSTLSAANTTLGADSRNYLEAAKSIHTSPTGQWNQLDCTSIAGKFAGFFLGQRIGNYQECPDTRGQPMSLQKNILDYWGSQGLAFQTFYNGSYMDPLLRTNAAAGAPLQTDPLRGKNTMMAYMPGPDYGATEDGLFPHPFGAIADMKSDRNYYSTKFVALQTLATGSGLVVPYVEGGAGGFTTYSEGTNKAPADIEIGEFENKLDTRYLSDDIKTIME